MNSHDAPEVVPSSGLHPTPDEMGQKYNMSKAFGAQSTEPQHAGNWSHLEEYPLPHSPPLPQAIPVRGQTTPQPQSLSTAPQYAFSQWGFSDDTTGAASTLHGHGHQQFASPAQNPPSTTQGYGAGGEGEKEEGQSKEALILGLRPATFWLSLALIVVIVAAAVGAGVGGSMAVENARKAGFAEGSSSSQNSTSCPTIPSTAPGATNTTGGDTNTNTISAPTTGIVDFSCSELRAQSPVPINLGNNQFRFDTACNTDFNKERNGPEIDVAAIITYSARHCMQACASYNRNLGSDVCVAVTFRANLTDDVARLYGNCFLKNGTGTVGLNRSDYVASFRLQARS